MRDSEKYSWDPKGLLSQICRVYLNLYSADRQGVFAAAIAADARSYRPQMFAEASYVLRQFQLLGETEVRDGCSAVWRRGQGEMNHLVCSTARLVHCKVTS